MITGRNLYAVNSLPKDDYRKLYLANVLREASMAHKVTELMKTFSSKKDKFLVVCGAGHMAYGYGVPERIWQKNFLLKQQTYSIYC